MFFQKFPAKLAIPSKKMGCYETIIFTKNYLNEASSLHRHNSNCFNPFILL